MELVTIQLDKERHLRLTLRGMLAYESLTGKSLFKGFDVKKLTMKDVTILLWACLIDEDRELRYEDFIDMVDIGDIPRLTDALSQCIVISFPDTKEGEEAPLVSGPQSG